MVKLYLYLNDDGSIAYTSRNEPLKYEDQTDVIVVEVDNDFNAERLQDLLGLKANV